jgi:hypothetical protein
VLVFVVSSIGTLPQTYDKATHGVALDTVTRQPFTASTRCISSMHLDRPSGYRSLQLNHALYRILRGPSFGESRLVHPRLRPWYEIKALKVWHKQEGELRKRDLRAFRGTSTWV